ncbi:MAG: GFA family protein [Alphaproteobacteria bacterium]|nr:GFA family protein [Alphaproteobacteria bacterium]
MSADADVVRTGRCLCGAIRFRATGAPKWVAHCHCESCRRQTASAFTTYAGYLRDRVVFEGSPPAHFASSPGVTRSFCPRCGTPLAFQGARWPDELHLFLATFDDPMSLTPKVHVNVAEQLGWIHLADDLPRLAGMSAPKPPPPAP